MIEDEEVLVDEFWEMLVVDPEGEDNNMLG